MATKLHGSTTMSRIWRFRRCLPRRSFSSVALLVLTAIAGVVAGFWVGAASMVYSTNCELRRLHESCSVMHRMQSVAVALFAIAPIAILFIAILPRDERR